MSTQQVADILVRFNKWRRGDDSVSLPTSQEVGVAIDFAISVLTKQNQK